jgi:hypothetical protein
VRNLGQAFFQTIIASGKPEKESNIDNNLKEIPMPVPTITLSKGDPPTLILNRGLVKKFSTLAPPIQRKAIRILEEFIQEIYANGSLAHLLELQATTEAQLAANPGHRANGGKFIRLDLLDKCNWQLCQFLRVCSILV